MGSHLIDGEFQSDKYPTTPRGCVPLKPSDPTARDLLWEYAQRRRPVDPEFADDLEQALRLQGYKPRVDEAEGETVEGRVWELLQLACGPVRCDSSGSPDPVAFEALVEMVRAGELRVGGDRKGESDG